MKNGKLISFEGINGVGKTFFLNRLEEYYSNNPNVVFKKEIMNEIYHGIQKQIFEILFSTHSQFFDIGLPLTETALLVAKTAHSEETFIKPAMLKGISVVSDRSIDSICVYQALMLTKKYGGNPLQYASKIFDVLSQFCTIPTKTFLFKNDFATCVDRAEKRDNGRFSEKEVGLLKAIDTLYCQFAELHKDRIEVVNLSEMNAQIVVGLLVNGINKYCKEK